MSTAVIPEPIAQLQRQLDQIRSTQPRGKKLPDSVWQAAVELAREHGVYSVAHPLRLDYTGQQKQGGTRQAPIQSRAICLMTDSWAGSPAGTIYTRNPRHCRHWPHEPLFPSVSLRVLPGPAGSLPILLELLRRHHLARATRARRI
jgi:hypothetical protein